MKDMKTITEALNIVKKTEDKCAKIEKFLTTNSGKSFIKQYSCHKYTIQDLLRMYNIKYIRAHRDFCVLHSIMNKHVQNNIVDYTKVADSEIAYEDARKIFVKNWQKTKPQFKLLPYEQKLLNMRDQWKIKTDTKGKPIIKHEKTIRKGELAPRLLFDARTGLPIYCFSPKATKMGIALKLHMLETHKMKKYDKIAEINKKRDCERDLFPEQIVQKYKMLREAHLEQLRDDLANSYCPRKVTVVLQHKETENVTKVETGKELNIGCIRHGKLLKSRSKHKLAEIGRKFMNDYPEHRLTCIHLSGVNGRYGKVLLPETFGLAA